VVTLSYASQYFFGSLVRSDFGRPKWKEVLIITLYAQALFAPSLCDFPILKVFCVALSEVISGESYLLRVVGG